MIFGDPGASNFTFQHKRFPFFEGLASLPERYLHLGSQSYLMKAGLLCKILICGVFVRDNIILLG